jgi:hypothetical protein
VVFVRLRQKQIPAGVQCIDFELKVLVAIAVGVDKNFKIVVAKDNTVVFGQRSPNMRFFQFGGDVEVLAVPLHLGPRLEPRQRFRVPLYVDEQLRPWRFAPLPVDAPIDYDRLFRARAIVAIRGGPGVGGKQ